MRDRQEQFQRRTALFWAVVLVLIAYRLVYANDTITNGVSSDAYLKYLPNGATPGVEALIQWNRSAEGVGTPPIVEMVYPITPGVAQSIAPTPRVTLGFIGCCAQADANNASVCVVGGSPVASSTPGVSRGTQLRQGVGPVCFASASGDCTWLQGICPTGPSALLFTGILP